MTKEYDVLTTHIGMLDLLESDRRKKINDTKDEDLYIDCRYIFDSETHTEILFSHYKYIKNKDP